LTTFLPPKTPSFAALATRNFTTIKTRARFPLLLHQLAETGQDKFATLFDLFVGERTKSIQEYSRGSFVGLGGFGKCALKGRPKEASDCLSYSGQHKGSLRSICHLPPRIAKAR
jgi:hypothetical protein